MKAGFDYLDAVKTEMSVDLDTLQFFNPQNPNSSHANTTN